MRVASRVGARLKRQNYVKANIKVFWSYLN